ncbi:MAG: hypothetical protein K6B74_00460 [Ruminococcus sp.]|nr:hypothetical protein [Ruminococcus sp.]
MNNTHENEPDMTAIPAEDMALINKQARRELSPEEVYTFPVVLCDNETDRDGERFSLAALEKLAELFVGKTGIFDHDPRGRNQTARIYFAETVTDSERVTRSGEPYTCVRAKAYMMRTDGSADLIKEIDGGIKKEVSVSCAVSRKTCGLCGADMRVSPCSHIRGHYYGGKLCDVVLDGITDAYEWSFVAVPAQPAAGITKAMEGVSEKDLSRERRAMQEQLSLDRGEIGLMKSALISEAVRLGQFCVPPYEPETVKALCGGMSANELISFVEKTRRLARPEPVSPALKPQEPAPEPKRNSLFKIKPVK